MLYVVCCCKKKKKRVKESLIFLPQKSHSSTIQKHSPNTDNTSILISESLKKGTLQSLFFPPSLIKFLPYQVYTLFQYHGCIIGEHC